MKKISITLLLFLVVIDALVAQSNDLNESWETDADFIFINHLESYE